MKALNLLTFLALVFLSNSYSISNIGGVKIKSEFQPLRGYEPVCATGPGTRSITYTITLNGYDQPPTALNTFFGIRSIDITTSVVDYELELTSFGYSFDSSNIFPTIYAGPNSALSSIEHFILVTADRNINFFFIINLYSSSCYCEL